MWILWNSCIKQKCKKLISKSWGAIVHRGTFTKLMQRKMNTMKIKNMNNTYIAELFLRTISHIYKQKATDFGLRKSYSAVRGYFSNHTINYGTRFTSKKIQKKH